MTTLTDKELIKEIKERIGSLDVRDNIERRAYEIALASLEAEPIAWECGENIILFNPDTVEAYAKRAEITPKPLFAAPPAPVVPEEMYWQDAPVEGSIKAAAYATGWNACRAAMLQGGQPVNQTYNLPELIEGMEVSIDVSTCDADLGNRYFGTVTEALELDTAKNGYILLVQDAEPNFDVNGNSPGTPDSWISCSERMPDDGQHVIILCDGAFVLYAQYRDGEFFDIVRNGDEFFETQSRNVTDWMRLPEPPQEVNRG
ncbi:DUF551 domain-containing protein [Escherichia coli]|uniref:DUF551 domain-containing protein n=1 Tax=Escherichia coli TaxID=562 RepID=UPI003AF3AD68|nr:DUF551 domain-containing protein [Escherichia coli]